MKKSFVALVALVSVTSAFAGGMPKGDATAGQALAAQCAACHGADGNSAAPTFPRLAGQNAKYIYLFIYVILVNDSSIYTTLCFSSFKNDRR